MFTKLSNEVASVGMTLELNDDGSFNIKDHPGAATKINRIVKNIQDDFEVQLINGVNLAWETANENTSLNIEELFGKKLKKMSPERRSKYFSNNPEAREAFLGRKNGGLALSSGVWNNKEFKNQIADSIEVCLYDGKTPAQMSRAVRSYLKEPNKLFRRVRDKNGKLKLSKAAKEYHPGAGVYRSSYKNAMRLARTETNMAYHAADYLRWQQMDFVVGIEVRLSNNHNCVGIKPGHFFDICDELKGKYPKDFKFVGWHPHCRCHAVPIFKTDEEFDRDEKRILEGKNPINKSVNTVGDIPEQFNTWVEDNKERAKGWSSMPYFIRHNPQYVRGFEVDTYTKAERKFTRARKTNEAMQESLGIFLQRKYPEIPNTEKAAIYHYTKGEGAAFRQLNNQLRKGKLSEFNEAFSQLLSQGLSKLETTTETAYRALRLNKTNLMKYLSLAEEQGTTTFAGFTSTSVERRAALDMVKKWRLPRNNETDVLFVIRGKSGHPIEDLSQFGGRFAGKPNQREVLFDKGLNVRFDKVVQEGEQLVFYLTEI